MGVRGLQTFLKENRQSLCRSVLLDARGRRQRGATPVVVDAWGIIYQLYLDTLPWTSGGEYYRFYRLARRLVNAWRDVGLEPVFVFDEKHATTLDRLQGQVATARMFYTISVPTRSAPSFARSSSSILPPFALQAFTRALADLHVAAHFVAVGEADGMCVVMADEMGGYVMGKDTDFMILASSASDNMRGYAPLDMVEWIEGSPEESAVTADWSFTPVKHVRRRGRTSRLLPPRGYRNPTLVLATYTAPALCRRLRLPANLLPLFSSLVGNDYTPASVTETFFTNGTKPSDRIDRVARILREQHSARATAAANHGDAAADLVRRVVHKLCVKPYVNDRLVDEIVDSIIEATIQYVLPLPSECCDVYPFCGGEACPAASRMVTPASTPLEASPAMSAYAAAQHRGQLNLVTHAWLYPSRIYLWGTLEDPSGPCARGGSVAMAARTAAYLFVEEALGGLRFPAATSDQLEESKQDMEACKLLGVEEGEESEAAAAVVDDDPVDPSPRRVLEYLRQGSSNRITERTTDLPPPLDNPAPTCLLPVDQRLVSYLASMGADTPAMRALPPRLQPLAAVVRLCVVQAAAADTSGARRWRKPEIEAVLRAGIGCLEGGWSLAADEDNGDDSDDDVEGDYPLLTNSSAEMTAQLTAAFMDAQVLAQSLLLAPDAAGTGPDAPQLTHLTPFVFISGVALHSLLGGTEPPAAAHTGWRWNAAFKHGYHAVLAAVLGAVPEDAVGTASRPETKKEKRDKRGGPSNGSVYGRRSGSGAPASGRASGGGGGGRFDLLIDADL